MKVRLYASEDRKGWDDYAVSHPDSTHSHLSGWKEVIEGTYRHSGHYLLAEEHSQIVGILPLIHMRTPFLGSLLCSMPFLNYGGILSDSPVSAEALLQEAVNIASRLGAHRIELRQPVPLSCQGSRLPVPMTERAHKVRMVLPLSGPAEAFHGLLKSKLKSQIRRPLKEGMTVKIGGAELADDFYAVFARNMRDLGSPVHSAKLFRQIFRHLDEGPRAPAEPSAEAGSERSPRAQCARVRIGVVYHRDGPVAVGLIVAFKQTVEIPWASSLRDYNRFSPNMLLYWSLIEYAIKIGCRQFDFGRSTPEEGTYRFKEQWGAAPKPLHWYVIGARQNADRILSDNDSKMRGWAASLWSRLPLSAANRIGPWIRGALPL